MTIFFAGATLMLWFGIFFALTEAGGAVGVGIAAALLIAAEIAIAWASRGPPE